MGMAHITQFDRTNIRFLRLEIEQALAAIGTKYGIEIKGGNATFVPTNMTIKLELTTKTADGTVVSKEREDYKQFASAVGLKPEWLDREFTSQRMTFKITGLNTNAIRRRGRGVSRPVVCLAANGKIFVFDIAAIVRYMDPAAATTKPEPVIASHVVGPKNPDHTEIERRLNEFRNNNPEGYYADGEHRANGANDRQIHDMHYRRIAQEIAWERMDGPFQERA